MNRFLVTLLIEGRPVYMFVGAPGETMEQIRQTVMESMAITVQEFDDDDEERKEDAEPIN